MIPRPWPRGWTLDCEEDSDEPRKRTWWLVSPAGKRHLLDVSPWLPAIPAGVAAMMVDLGVPTRADFGIVYPVPFEMIEARWGQWAAGQQQIPNPCTGEAA